MSLDPHAIVSGTDRSLRARLLRAGLAAAEPGYRVAIAARNRAFDAGWRQVHRLARPAISVGNLTAGGTGKTPMVARLCRHLASTGHRPAVLTRGYATADEPALLAAELGPDVPIAASPDRLAAARQVMDQRPDTSVFVLDDGFQRRQLHRDLDLVLIDATCPLGHGRLLPRGLLREPATSLDRADAVIVTRSDAVSDAELRAVDALVRQHHGQPPIAHACHAWTGWRQADATDPLPPCALAGQRVAAAVGLGNPAAFHKALQPHVAEVVMFRPFPDHHAFTAADLAAFERDAVAAGATILVTSEKDHIKWAPLLATTKPSLPIARPILAMNFRDGWDALARRLAEATGD